MRKLIAIVAVSLMTMTAAAQIDFGVKGGLNVSNISLNGDLTKNLKGENQAGFFIGPTMKVTLPIVGLGFDVSALYDQKSSKVAGVSVKQKAIVVPINLRYGVGLGDLATVYGFAGPQFGFNVGDKDYDIESNTLDYNLKSSNLSLNLGVGAVVANHYQLSVNYNIALGKTGEFEGLGALKDKIGDAKTNSWQIGIAYYF
jgi:opacity protein-like surface antigen